MKKPRKSQEYWVEYSPKRKKWAVEGWKHAPDTGWNCPVEWYDTQAEARAAALESIRAAGLKPRVVPYMNGTNAD